jgi:hypothetical protein
MKTRILLFYVVVVLQNENGDSVLCYGSIKKWKRGNCFVVVVLQNENGDVCFMLW